MHTPRTILTAAAAISAALFAAPQAANSQESGGARHGFVDHFSAATLDADLWQAKTSAAGAVTLPGDSFVIFDSPSNADAAFVQYRRPLHTTTSQTWTFCIRAVAGDNLPSLIALWGLPDGEEPESGPTAEIREQLRAAISIGHGAAGSSIRFRYDPSANGAGHHWRGDPANTWSSLGVAAEAIEPIREGPDADWYVVGFQIDSAQQAMRFFGLHRRGGGIADGGQGVKLVALTDWVPFSAFAPAATLDNLWLTIGDRHTDAAGGTCHVEWVRAEHAVPLNGWTNLRDQYPDPYFVRRQVSYGAQFLPVGRNTNVFELGPTNAWNQNGYRKKHIVLAEGTYHMFYEGFDSDSRSALGLATASSPEGPWTPVVGNPVVPRSQLPNGGNAYDVLTAPWAVWDAADPDPARRWKLFATGEVVGTSIHRIFLLTAPSAAGPWTRVIGSGPDGSVIGESQQNDWKHDGANDPLVWWDAEEQRWHMLLGGIRSGFGWSVGFAVSSDLIHWSEPVANPLIAANDDTLVTWTAANGKYLTVADASAFVEDAIVTIRNRPSSVESHVSRIRRITGNVLELYHEIAGLGGTDPNRGVAMAGSGSVTPHALIREPGGAYRLYVTSFQSFILGPGDFGSHELVASLTAPSPTGPWAWDHLGGPHVPLTIWGGLRSHENIALVNAPQVCGNGLLDLGEACDDGNALDDDGCSSHCSVVCGDGFCVPTEDPCKCPADCGAPTAQEHDCADGIDNDCDGDVDCRDLDCEGAICGDSRYCNGAETCNPAGVCLPGIAPCSANHWCDEIVDACVPWGDGDFDGDLDVDLLDYAFFQQCFDQFPSPACIPGNLTGEAGHIDLADFTAFEAVLSGPTKQPATSASQTPVP